jgi:hypothetical protein
VLKRSVESDEVSESGAACGGGAAVSHKKKQGVNENMIYFDMKVTSANMQVAWLQLFSSPLFCKFCTHQMFFAGRFKTEQKGRFTKPCTMRHYALWQDETSQDRDL